MKVFSFISQIFEPMRKLVDDVHTSQEEKLQITAKMEEAKYEMLGQVLDYEHRLLDSRTKVITSEAEGKSWMQRNWRPITMLTFLALVVMDSFGILKNSLAPEAWTLLQIGLGGYVVGRSAEKITQQMGLRGKLDRS